MGNSSAKESRSSGDRRSGESSSRSPPSQSFFSLGQAGGDGNGVYGSRGARGSRHDLGFFSSGPGPSEREADPHGPRRETRQEREARKLEKERQQRAKERERSLKDEGVDGGYLVTLGTYVGPEDFSKPTVRRLQLERRLAPFWRGLNEHSNEWTEHQLVAAARGLPIPAPDQIPTQDDSPNPDDHSFPSSGMTIPAASSTTNAAGATTQVTPHTPAFGASAVSQSPASGTHSSLFLARAKGLASLSPPKPDSPQEFARQEVRLPQDRNVNGQPLEAYLYKDPGECPICFLYYPPYLNRTRCCDQPICSECFVQIKRPDPHPPEHTDPNSPAPPEGEEPPIPGLENQLVSEPATCPFCVLPEFGITYDPPPFRRGIIYADQPLPSSPIPVGQNVQQRRRGQSVSANAPGVIGTDMVRPDWARKLADARAHAARRSAAATALHSAAYMMNGQGGGASFPGLGRRRRTGESSSGGFSGRDLLPPSQMEQLMAVLESGSARGQRQGSQDLYPSRGSSRNNRTEDLEELMMMEAIRLSLQAEEERKKKEEKEAAKEAKKEEKQRAKEQKKAEKAAKKNGSYSSSRNNSQFFSSSTNLAAEQTMPQQHLEGGEADKGKAKASGNESSKMTHIGFNPLDEPTSVLGEMHGASKRDAETTLRTVPETAVTPGEEEEQSTSDPVTQDGSNAAQPLQQDLSFRSLAEMIDHENASGATVGHQD